jgi:hypothetical protein
MIFPRFFNILKYNGHSQFFQEVSAVDIPGNSPQRLRGRGVWKKFIRSAARRNANKKKNLAGILYQAKSFFKIQINLTFQAQ